MLLVQQIINGLLVGGVYALVATGLTLTLGVLRIMNLAQGATLSVAAIIGVEFASNLNAPFVVVLLVGALAGAVIGLGLELFAFRWLRRRGSGSESAEWSSMVSSLAMLILLEALAQYVTFDVIHNQVLSFPTSTFRSHAVTLFSSVSVRSIDLVMFVLALVLTLAVWGVIRFTQVGRACRAVASDPEAAGMLGINSNAYALSIVSASGALAGIAGVLVGLAFNSMDFTTGDSYLLRGFAVVILGGIGSVIGTLVGGLVLGLAEGLTVYYVGTNWVDVMAFALLFLVLLIRPRGLFGQQQVDRA